MIDNPSTKSHSERDILDACIGLMQSLTESFRDYLYFIGVETDEDDTFTASFSYSEIVQRLFLTNTMHSGGTSTRKKCNELGVDYTKRIVFDCRYDEDE